MEAVHKTCDVLIVGSGLAGLSCAKYLSEFQPDLRVTIITKSGIMESNTVFAQGGLACVNVHAGDAFENHIDDTMNAGGGVNNKRIVEMVVRNAPSAIEDLKRWGVRFDSKTSGEFDLALEGGHSVSRVVHCLDSTGKSVEQTLSDSVLEESNVDVEEYVFAYEILTDANMTSAGNYEGVLAFDLIQKKWMIYKSQALILATGGIGQVFAASTNSSVATGDAVSMANRAGADIENMHWIQFHPTAISSRTGGRTFLISEALRGAGAHLVNHAGKRFMLDVHPMAELAPRDIVSRAIMEEMQINKVKNVFLDCRHMNASDLKNQFPSIYSYCLSTGFPPDTRLIPVAPSAHYSCGGIAVDYNGMTSIESIYACGECSSTGLHGANRLASNSLTEAIVYAKICAKRIVKSMDKKPLTETTYQLPEIDNSETQATEIEDIKRDIQSLMTESAGPFRSNYGLSNALTTLSKIEKKIREMRVTTGFSTKLGELQNICETAILVTQHAAIAKSNVGLHFNVDLEHSEMKK